MGTIFEESHIEFHKWLQAIRLMCSSKKGISAHQLHRTLEVTYKTAWFLAHRLRLAMKVTPTGPIGGAGKTVEIDETFIGMLEGQDKAKGGYAHKDTMLTLVERDGEARSFHMAKELDCDEATEDFDVRLKTLAKAQEKPSKDK